MLTDKIDELTNSCTLHAVREVTRKSDAEILAAFIAHGYVRNQGMTHDKWTDAARDLGMQLEEVSNICTRNGGWSVNRMTLAQFVHYYPTGTYFISVHRHALVVRDGQVVDSIKNPRTSGMRRRVRFAKRVVNAPVVSVRLVVNHAVAEPIKILVPANVAKRRGTGAYERYTQMVAYLLGNPTARIEEIITHTSYTLADYNWDRKKGFIG